MFKFRITTILLPPVCLLKILNTFVQVFFFFYQYAILIIEGFFWYAFNNSWGIPFSFLQFFKNYSWLFIFPYGFLNHV